MNATETDSTIGLRIYKGAGVAILVLLNWFANSTCILVLQRLKEMNPVTKILMFSMTVNDIVVGCIGGFFVIRSIITDDWPFGAILCQATGIMNNAMFAGTTLHLLAINAERYIAVTRPFEYNTMVTKPKSYVAVVVLWILALSSGLLNHLLPGRQTVFNPVFHSCVGDPIDPKESDLIGTAWNAIFFLLPVAITLLMFFRLYRIARYHAARIAAQSANNKAKPNLKGSFTFFLMTVAILSLGTPTLLGYLYENITRNQVPLWFSYACTHLIFSYSVVNVGIYYARNSAFRRTAKILWERLIKGGNSSVPVNQSSAAVVSQRWP